jgi:hypothetical protein
MNDSISTDGPQRPRVRRGLAVVVGVTLMATPLALAPAASAQSGGALGGLDNLLAGILEGLAGGNTLGNLLGGGSSEQKTCYKADGLGSTLSCVVVPLDNTLNPGRKAKAKVQASMRKGKVRSLRAVR